MLNWHDHFNNDREAGTADLDPGMGRASDRLAPKAPAPYDPSEGCSGPEYGFCAGCTEACRNAG